MLENSYNVFATVANCKNFTRAAEQLNLTASAVSHTISKLEEEMGFPLFIRHRGGVSLTTNGERILQYINELKRSHTLLDKEIREIRNNSSGLLRIAATQSTTISWLSKILPSFKESHPDIEITLRQGIHAQIVSWLENYEVDVAICAFNKRDNFNFTPLYNDPIIYIAQKGFTPSGITYVTAEELRGSTLIVHHECAELEVPEFMHEYQITRDDRFNLDDDLSIISIVNGGICTAMMPKLAFDALNENANFFSIIPGPYRILGISLPKRDAIDPITGSFCQELTRFVADYKLR